MSREIKIIGENYPKVGDIFYWKDMDGNIQEDVCVRIEAEDNPDLETMYFTQYNDGCGSFITEDCIINPLSMEIELYKRNKRKEQIIKFAKQFDDEDFRSAIYPIVRRFLDEDYASMLLDRLADPQNYE